MNFGNYLLFGAWNLEFIFFIMGTLYIIATPIGNLKDITLRAIEMLKNVDIILAEDTRVAKKLLSHLGIKKPVWRADATVERAVAEKIKKELEMGRNIAYMSDAGTPNISDPGAFIARHIRANMPMIKIVPIPGPSSLTAFLSVSGVSANQFTFFGYPPHKKGRKKFFEKIKNNDIQPAVIFESTHRIQKTFDEIAKTFGCNQIIIVGKELTKIYEEIWQGTAEEAEEYFKGVKGKGEFVIVIAETTCK